MLTAHLIFSHRWQEGYLADLEKFLAAPFQDAVQEDYLQAMGTVHDGSASLSEKQKRKSVKSARLESSAVSFIPPNMADNVAARDLEAGTGRNLIHVGQVCCSSTLLSGSSTSIRTSFFCIDV